MGHSLPTRLAPASRDVCNALEADVLGTHLFELIKERVAQALVEMTVERTGRVFVATGQTLIRRLSAYFGVLDIFERVLFFQ